MTTNPPIQITVCGIGELTEYRAARVTHVLSILDPGAPVPPDFAAFGAHERLELRFHDIIEEQPDMLCPRPGHIEQLLQFVQQLLEEPRAGAHLLVHCHAGVSRSPASAILILAKLYPEVAAAEFVSQLLRDRPQVWPNLRMIEIGDGLLGRRGEIVSAVGRLYGWRLERDPDLDPLMREVGRRREIEVAMRSGWGGMAPDRAEP
jgi:predicted protein tyrosine phosphatase